MRQKLKPIGGYLINIEKVLAVQPIIKKVAHKAEDGIVSNIEAEAGCVVIMDGGTKLAIDDVSAYNVANSIMEV